MIRIYKMKSSHVTEYSLQNHKLEIFFMEESKLQVYEVYCKKITQVKHILFVK